MIKEILILLWILIIPLVIDIRQLYLKIDRKKWEELGSSNKYAKLFFMVFGFLLLITVPIFYEDSSREFSYMFAGIVITFDAIIFLSYCLSEYKSTFQRIITCSFVIFNCVTSVLWILHSELSNKSLAIGIYLYCVSGFLYTILFDRRKIK